MYSETHLHILLIQFQYMDVFSYTPDEILAEIIQLYLQDTNDVKNVSLTCKRWASIVKLIMDKNSISVAKLMAVYFSEEDNYGVIIDILSPSMEKLMLHFECALYVDPEKPTLTHKVCIFCDLDGLSMPEDFLYRTKVETERLPCTLAELFPSCTFKYTHEYDLGARITIREMERLMTLSLEHKDPSGGLYFWIKPGINYRQRNNILNRIFRYGVESSDSFKGWTNYFYFLSWKNAEIAVEDKIIKQMLLFKRITYTMDAMNVATKKHKQ